MDWFSTRKRPADKELDSELGFHFQKLIDEKVAAGLTLEDARREAALEFGGREQIKEDLRDVHRIAIIEAFLANVQSGVRLIRKSPAFSLAVILTLALGIGANSAIFSALDAILLRPLPFPEGDQLMLLHQAERKANNPTSFVAPLRLTDWNQLNHTFRAISGWYTQDVSELSGALPERVTEALVAPRFLQVWGVPPVLGRDFTPAEERFGGPTAVLISYRLWRRRFHTDPRVIEKQLRLDAQAYTIVGVMPASFAFPDHDVDIWVPSPMDAPYAQSRESTWFTVIGRLKPGAQIGQARADLNNVQAQLGKQFPKSDAQLVVDIQPLKETIVGGTRRSLWVLFGSVSLLLLIACTNIAALLLARTAEREREIAVRFSLGASRTSLVAQLLTECLVLAFAGSILGLVLAAAASNIFRVMAKSLPRADEIRLDWHILLYTLACSFVVAILCGLFPAIRVTRREIRSELTNANRTQVSARSRLQWLLVGVQTALAVTLLVGAGLLLRSLQELGRVSPGFDSSKVLTLRISGNWGETVDYKKLMARVSRTLDELRSVPGVSSAATAGMLPGIPADGKTEVKAEGRSENQGRIFADSRFVSDGYFTTVKIPLLAGVGCRPALDAHDVIVNRSFANKYFGGSRAVGYHLQVVGNLFLPPAEIRGIAADAREQGLNREPAPTIYWCINAPNPSPYFLIRTQTDPLSMAETIRRKIHAVEPARSVFDISPLEQHLSDNFAENRLRTLLLTMFALTAVSLACIGVYGTLSYFVNVRRREIGLRLALGAQRGQIVNQFLLHGVGVVFAGCAAGLCLGAGFARQLSSMLYGISSVDPQTFLSVTLLVLIIAAVASLLPSIRAARVDPMQVLRDE